MTFLPLIWIRFFFFQRREKRWIQKQSHPAFAKIGRLMQKHYAGINPYTVCRKFLQEKGDQQIHAYGETPLPVFGKIFSLCNLQPDELFLDLGSGRGWGVFLAAEIYRSQAIGIEQIPLFCHVGTAIGKNLSHPPIFLQEDILQTDLSKATLIYFYALCMEDSAFDSMTERLKNLKPGTKIVTVSEPLPSCDFQLITSFSAKFPWGATEVYVQTPFLSGRSDMKFQSKRR